MHRTSLMLASISTSESSGGPGTPTFTVSLTNPIEFAAAWFASGEPIVTDCEVATGGLQDGNTSGGPCCRLGVAQACCAGTIDAYSGDAPFGRGWVALAIEAITMIPTAPSARASGNTILFLMVIYNASLPC
jgi:hypothetical protein